MNTKHLPIYQASYRLLKLVAELVRHFPRDFRPTAGAILQEETMKLVLDVYNANAAMDKEADIASLQKRLKVVELLLQLVFDMQFINSDALADAAELTESIGRQSTGWRKGSRRQAQ